MAVFPEIDVSFFSVLPFQCIQQSDLFLTQTWLYKSVLTTLHCHEGILHW